METIFEIVCEFLLDGCMEIATSPEVPKPVRGVLLAVITAVYLFMAGIFTYFAVTNEKIAVKILFLLLVLLFIGFLIRLWWKFIRSRRAK